MHFAPVTRCATHSSLGCTPFDARPNSLTPSAHWTGSPTTFFFSRIAVLKPAAASGRAAIPPAGPAPPTTASYIPGWRRAAAISALHAGLSGGPKPPALARRGGRYDDIQQRGPLDLEQVLRDRRRRYAHLGRELRDLRVPVAVHFVLHNNRKDLALTFREEARPVARVHPGRRTSRAVLSVFVERRREGLCLTTSEYDSVARARPSDTTRVTRSKAISSGPIPAPRCLVCPATGSMARRMGTTFGPS